MGHPRVWISVEKRAPYKLIVQAVYKLQVPARLSVMTGWENAWLEAVGDVAKSDQNSTK
jgi:hypothetical protein